MKGTLRQYGYPPDMQKIATDMILRQAELIADELFTEAKKKSPDIAPEYRKNKILERRSNIQYELDLAHMKEGCSTSAIEMTKEHYQEFSHYKRSEIRKFIDEKTKD